MSDFWFCFVIFGVLFVPLILMFLICGCTWSNKIGGAIVCLLFWFAISGAMYTENKWDNEAWNNGICPVCEGEYRFSGASKYRTSNYYYYTCDNCGHTIEINQLMR